MTTTHWARTTRTLATAVALVAVAGTTTGCGSEEPPEPGTPTATATSAPEPTVDAGEATGTAEATPAYTGPYDRALRESLADYSGERITLTGEVADLIRSRASFELVDPGSPDLDPLLVSARYAVPDIATGDTVEVTGTVRTDFSAPVAEPAVEGDEEAEFYDQHLGEPYLDEAVVEVARP